MAQDDTIMITMQMRSLSKPEDLKAITIPDGAMSNHCAPVCVCLYV